MKGSRFSEEQIIAVLREQEAGARTGEVCRRHGLSSATLYKWKAKYGGLEVSDARRLKALEDENRKLKRLLADSLLDNAALKDLLEKTAEACGATRGGEQGDGASRAESAACVRTGRTGSLDHALPVPAAGRHGNKGAAARAGCATPAVRVSAIGLDARTRGAQHQSQEALPDLSRGAAHGAAGGEGGKGP